MMHQIISLLKSKNPKNKWNGSLSWSLFAAIIILLSSSSAFAEDCYGLYRQQKYVEASQCFEKQAKKLGSNPSGTSKLEKGRSLRNAALSLDRAAKRSNAANAANYRSKAIEILSRYLKQKLYGSNSMRDATKQLIRKFTKQIGFANLVLVTNHPKARTCLVATGFKKCKQGTLWNLKLLPKTYQIEVTYPLSPPEVKKKTFKAIPRTKKTIIFAPPVKKIGRLSVVTSDPTATILLKGGKRKAPLTHTGAIWTKELPAGSYQLTIVYPGQKSIERSVKITTGKTTGQIFTKPGPPVVVINTTPINAQVFVNGKYMGNTGIRLKLQAGHAKIEIKRGCYEPVVKELELLPNKETYVSVVLKRDPIYLDWYNKKQSGGNATLGWVSLIGGVALAGTGGAMYGVASGKHADALEVRPSDFKKYQSLAGENNTFVTIGHIGVGLGVVGIGVGVATLLMSRPQSRYSLACKVKLKDEN